MKKILASVLVALFCVGPAFADTCSKNLTGVFTAPQAVALCTKLTAAIGASLVPQTTATYDLGSSSLKWRNLYLSGDYINSAAGAGLIIGEASRAANVTTALNAVAPALYSSMDATLGGGTALVGFGAGASGIQQGFFKTRAVSGQGTTIVQNGDQLGLMQFWGANGTGYTAGAQIVATVSGTPGASADMPSKLDFRLSPDASGTPASVLSLDQDKAALFTGTVRSSATGSIGWSVVAGANTACNTTCTSACVTGIDTLGTGGFLDCTTATADFCLCAGAS